MLTNAVSFIKVVVSTIPYFWQRLACRGVGGGGGENGDVCENVMWILSINLIKTSPIIV